MHSAKHWISIVLGLLLMLLGILPILSMTGVIGLSFHSWLGKLVSIFAYIIAFGGVYMIVDSFHEIGSMTPFLGWITLILGFIVLALGVVKILVDWAVLGFSIPALPEVFYFAVFILEGILLFIAGFLD